jgi:1-acyl-sn-glycerol-3-phosphate acyltransferase
MAENRGFRWILTGLLPDVMFRFLPAPLRGTLAVLLLVANTACCFVPIMAFGLLKLVLPFAPVRRVLDHVLNALATGWITLNGLVLWDAGRTRLDAQGHEQLSRRDWAMVVSNHQSWVDILVLQRVFNRRIPYMKFFLKWELIFVPLMGLAWWALDFPFMRRHSRAAVRANPQLRVQDRDAARRACAKFALVPTSVMTFPEGTRLTVDKLAAQAMPYRHLLKPKAGSLATSLNALGERFHSLLDTTIVYPDGVPSFWDFLCGRCPRVLVRVHAREIAPALCTGDFVADEAFRREFGRWLDGLWRAKDDEIEALLVASAPRALASLSPAGTQAPANSSSIRSR